MSDEAGMKPGRSFGNLIPNNERSQEELQEMGRKGGIASGKSRRRKRALRMVAQILAEGDEVNAIFEWFSGTIEKREAARHDQ